MYGKSLDQFQDGPGIGLGPVDGSAVFIIQSLDDRVSDRYTGGQHSHGICAAQFVTDLHQMAVVIVTFQNFSNETVDLALMEVLVIGSDLLRFAKIESGAVFPVVHL